MIVFYSHAMTEEPAVYNYSGAYIRVVGVRGGYTRVLSVAIARHHTHGRRPLRHPTTTKTHRQSGRAVGKSNRARAFVVYVIFR